MSDIKFRGKRVDNGEWVYGYYMSDLNMLVKHVIYTIGQEYNSHIQVDPETVGQYIGVKDANGTDVYKGDVFGTQIEGYSENCVVEYDECCFVLSNGKKKRPINTQEKSIHNWLPVGTGSAGYAPFEMIGNIHDNPNLLQP